MNVYCISGLGADHRVFAKLDLGEGHSVIPVTWVPSVKNESINDYAERLQTQIDRTQPHVLLGLSFGGVIAQELSGFTNPEYVIILSSIRSVDGIPWYYRMWKWLIPMVPNTLLKTPAFIIKWQFGVKDASWNLLKQIIKDQNPVFMKWALKALLNWKGIEKNIPNLVHIHGAKDRILTPQNPEAEVENSGHFMVYDNAEEVSEYIRIVLKEASEVVSVTSI